MSPAIADPLTRVAADLRACAESVAHSARVMRSTMQQTWTVADLRRRYRGITRLRLQALLTAHLGYQPGKGKRGVFTLEQVLRFDDAVAADVAVPT